MHNPTFVGIEHHTRLAAQAYYSAIIKTAKHKQQTMHSIH